MGELQRRDLMIGGGALVGMSLLQGRAFAQSKRGTVIPWSDQPPPVPPPAAGIIRSQTAWENLNSWITPNDKFFAIGHYDWPQIDPKDWRLDIGGLVENPAKLTLDQLKSLPRQEVTSTIECSGNNGLPFLTSAIGNARWTGTSLAAVLKAARVKPAALEVVFFGADKGEEVLRKDTPLELKVTENFARSMSREDAINPAMLLCYEMNGAPLPHANGFPVRLIAPGWYGIANVKWLNRIELRSTRYMGRFMGRDYVTVREEQVGERTLVTETSVGRGLLKSAPARVVTYDGRYRIEGMAWGPQPIAAVEVKIDNSPWIKAVLDDTFKSKAAWRFWHLDWSASPGEHSITTRAIDDAGEKQPAMDDTSISTKKTFWESNGQVTRRIVIA